MKRALKIILPVIFSLAVAIGLLGRQIATKATEDYWKLQPEFTGPDTIETVIYDEALGQIYVCYSDANHVNVYAESGEFRWAVGTPYIRGNQFCLTGGMLACYGDGEVYLYSAEDGTFLRIADQDEMDLPYDSDSTDQFAWDSFQVFGEEGNVLVERPTWYWIFDFFLTWCIAALAGLGFGFLAFLDRVQDARSARKMTELKDRRTKAYRAASIAMITLHLGYGVAMLFHELIHPWLIIGIFPITIHFIFAGWIWMDRPVRWGLPEEEYTITRFWRAANIASLIAMVVLYVAALTITQ